MDLYAYVQIGYLEHIMKENGIDVPRLRGLRLMAEEEPLNKEQIQEQVDWLALYEAESLIRARFHVNCNAHEYSSHTDWLADQYLIKDEKGETVGVNWDVVHGEKRKKFKYVMKQAKKRALEQFGMFNKYCG